MENDILSDICAEKNAYVAYNKKLKSEGQLLAECRNIPEPCGFASALGKKAAQNRFALIAELKKASPSKGLIRADFNPSQIAQDYATGGATCLSVLTDEPFFKGADEYLIQAREAVSLPVLRKDFIIDPYQVVESRAIGADCILLIMAAIYDSAANEIESAALSLGMDVLIEVHNEKELERALNLKSKLVGINNRNLKTLEIDLAVTERLAPEIPDNYITVCESGIYSHNDLLRMEQSEIYCFLVGESLMREGDIVGATQKLLGKL